MGNSFSKIGHGLTKDAAIDAAVAYLTTYGYIIEKEAFLYKDGIKRTFLFLKGYYWYEVLLEQTMPPIGVTATFIASLQYFVRYDSELREKIPNVAIQQWKSDKSKD